MNKHLLKTDIDLQIEHTVNAKFVIFQSRRIQLKKIL